MSRSFRRRILLCLAPVAALSLSLALLLGAGNSEAPTIDARVSAQSEAVYLPLVHKRYDTFDHLYPIEIVPNQMALSGDYATEDNCDHDLVCRWLTNAPSGTLLLGVDPTSPITTTWDGGSATAEVFLPKIYDRTVLVLEVSWPDRDGKGLHSPERNRTGTISLDGRTLWSMRTAHRSAFQDYYASQHRPILMTIVITQSITHTITFSVPARTAWDLSRIELTAYAYPDSITGIGYSPYRDCQYPDGTRQPTVEDVREDLFRLFHTTNAIRTYSARGINGRIPALANEFGLPVYAGAWLDGVPEDDLEIQALIKLACEADLAGGIVGNEVYLRSKRTRDDVENLVRRIREVKQGVRSECNRDLPVTTAEIDNLMFKWDSHDDAEPEMSEVFRPVLDEVDFVMVHIYPFWNGIAIDKAADFTFKRFNGIRDLIEREYPGRNKWLVIGEAGWPSGGAANREAVPNLDNQRRYLLEFVQRAKRDRVDYFYFDAFDELWKIEEPGRVGQHWGYSYTDRSAKHSFYGVLLPPSRLPPIECFPLGHTRGSADDGSQSSAGWPPTQRGANPNRASANRTFPVFTEWPMGEGHFVPSGWTGDTDAVDINECFREDPHSGDMAIQATFAPTGTLGHAGVYWQYPENNWGDLKDGLDLNWANKLTFWAKAEKVESGEEEQDQLPFPRIRFFSGGIGTKENRYPDSLRPEASTGFVALTDTWRQYDIDLRGRDLSHVIGGFGWATDQCASPDGATFFLDDIFFENDPDMPPPEPRGRDFPLYTDAAAQHNHYFPTGWMGDAEVPGRVTLTECWPDPHSGDTSIRVDYRGGSRGWAGIYWVHPAENWGDRPGGYDLRGAKRLTFQARTDGSSARLKFLIGGIGYWEGRLCGSRIEPYPDSVCPKIEEAKTLTNNWTQYSIDLSRYGDRDWSNVVGGFGFVAEAPFTFYLDDIIYEFDYALPN